MSTVQRAGDSGDSHYILAGKDCAPVATARSAADLECRRRHQLRSVGDWEADARLRYGPARGRKDYRAEGARRRDAEDSRWRRAQADFRRPRRLRREEAGGPRRSDGRIRHHDHREDAEHRDRVGVVGSGNCAQDVAATRAAHRRVAPLRARGGFRIDRRCPAIWSPG